MKATVASVLVLLLAAGCGGDGGGGGGDAAPPVTDIFTSPECVAFCKRLESACTGQKCDPKNDCDESGMCLAEKRAKLACKADPQATELTCETNGYGTVGLCVKPKNLCQ